MADTKLNDLASGAPAAGTDIIYAVKDPAGTPVDRKLSLENVKDYILGLANTFTATQTITPAANTNALAVTGYSLTGSNAQSLIDLAGTWNTTGTPTAIKLNVTDTASNAASLLMDLQVGGSSKARFLKDGSAVVGDSLYFNSTTSSNIYFDAVTSGIMDFYFGGTRVARWGQGADFNTGNIAVGARSGGGNGAFLEADANNILAQRNSTSAQTFRIYNTYTDASNYERVNMGWSGNVFSIAPTAAGTGTTRVIHISGLPTSNPGPGILWNNAGTPAIGT